MNIVIIGTGAYGLANAKALSKNKNNKITMWTEDINKVKDYELNHSLPKLLPDVELPKNLEFTTSFKEAAKDKEIIIIAVAAHFLNNTMKELSKFIKPNQVIIIATKGIENNTCSFLSDIVYKYTKSKKIAVMCGPAFAVDVASGEPIGLSVGCKSKFALNKIKEAYSNTNIKLRATTDLIGIQICGSIKNVIALAAGILSGLGYSNSTQAFLITESLHDIKGLIKALGGNKKSILSYAGVGDLLLTCTSTKSRNFSFGVLIGKKSTKEEINNYLENTTVEGYYTLKSIKKLIKRKKIDLPIVDLIDKIILKNENPELLANFLLEKK